MSPRRTCIGCRAGLHPDDGVRITLAPDGSLAASRSAPGRGAWLCRASAAACAEAATRRRGWGRALRGDVAAEAVQDLLHRLAGVPASVGEGSPKR